MKVVLVDDHDLLRTGVREFVNSLREYQVVGEARTARGALEVIASERPDIVVIDVSMPGMDGIVATREILRRSPKMRVIVFSAHPQLQDVRDAIDAGAIGYVLKSDPPDALARALDQATQGHQYLAPTLATALSQFDQSRKDSGSLDVLSERQREIFRLAADCRSSVEIARELCLSRKTVDTHLNTINRKLGIHNRAQLVRLAVGVGLVHSIRSTAPPRRPIDAPLASLQTARRSG